MAARLGHRIDSSVLFISLLVIIVVSDLAYMLIPDKVLIFFLPLLAIGRVLSPLTPWWDSLVGAVVGFGILYIIAVLSNGGMGGGDIKLFFLIGLVLGTIDTLLTLFSCSDWYDCRDYRFIEEQTREKNTIPFGPSIALAAVIVYFYGDLLINWYLGFW